VGFGLPFCSFCFVAICGRDLADGTGFRLVVRLPESLLGLPNATRIILHGYYDYGRPVFCVVLQFRLSF